MVKVSGTRSYSAMQILTWSVLEFRISIIQPFGLPHVSYDKVAHTTYVSQKDIYLFDLKTCHLT